MTKQETAKDKKARKAKEAANEVEMTLAQILGAKKAPTAEIPVVLDTVLSEALAVAQNAVNSINLRMSRDTITDAVLEGLNGELAEAEAALAEAEENAPKVVFKFRALGRQAFEDLQREYLPNNAEKEEFKKTLKQEGLPQNTKLPYSEKRFPPALIAACCYNVPMDYDDAVELWNHPQFSSPELGRIFGTCWRLNAEQ